jgi:hypothetical protein
VRQTPSPTSPPPTKAYALQRSIELELSLVIMAR